MCAKSALIQITLSFQFYKGGTQPTRRRLHIMNPLTKCSHIARPELLKRTKEVNN
jgi:hypothetical protein